MGSKWGNVARALGKGIQDIAQFNYKEKLETERQANMERIRQENREWKNADTKASQDFQLGRDKKSQEFQLNRDKEQNKIRASEAEKVRKHQTNLNNDRLESSEYVAELRVGNMTQGKLPNEAKLTEYWKTYKGNDGKLLFTPEEAVAMAKQSKSDSPQKTYGTLLAKLVAKDEYTAEEAAEKANEMTLEIYNFSLSPTDPENTDPAAPTIPKTGFVTDDYLGKF